MCYVVNNLDNISYLCPILGKLCIYETNLEYVLRRYQQEQGRKGNDLRERNSEGFPAGTGVVAL